MTFVTETSHRACASRQILGFKRSDVVIWRLRAKISFGAFYVAVPLHVKKYVSSKPFWVVVSVDETDENTVQSATSSTGF